jgi:hypothetical protein
MPLAPAFDTLGYAHARALDIVATCRHCGYSSEMNLSKLGAHFGWRTSYLAIEPRLRCSRCRKEGAKLDARRKVCPECKRPF